MKFKEVFLAFSVVVVLAFFILGCAKLSAQPTFKEKTTVSNSEIAKHLPPNMTFEGTFNPADVLDKTKYRAVAYKVVSGVLVVFCEARTSNEKPQYVAAAFVKGILLAVTWYNPEDGFHQKSVTRPGSGHFEIVQKEAKHYKNIQRDFQKAFQIPFPLPQSV